MKIGQIIIDTIRGKKKFVLEENIMYKPFKIEKLKNFSKKSQPCKMVVTTSSGFAYSGTSAIIGFLSEFDNVLAHGYCDPVYSKNKSGSGGETRWFVNSGFFMFTDAFKDKGKNLIKADMAIKLFIKQIYEAYKRKSLLGWDKAPEFYNNEFLAINLKYLKSVLNFNEYDLSVLEKEILPHLFNSSVDRRYENCSFMQEKGIKQYLFYKFREMSDEEFDRYTNAYITELFNRFNGKDIALFDKSIGLENHKKINQFMKDKPIKQICCLRDPRDEFLSTYRRSFATAHPPTASAREWIDYYRENADALKDNMDDNMLVVQFEDLVLNYDKVTKEIMNFLGLKPENHVAPKKVFDPEISKVNIGAWKCFIDQKTMEQIGRELREYCYDAHTFNNSK